MLNVDLKGFDEFENHLRTLSNGSFVKNGFKEFVNRARDAVIENTPVDTGNLKNQWANPVYEYAGNNMKATVKNKTDYGMAVNYGHHQEVGRYVPQINARLVREWIPGSYFMENALDHAEVEFSSIMSRNVKEAWRGGSSGTSETD